MRCRSIFGRALRGRSTSPSPWPPRVAAWPPDFSSPPRAIARSVSLAGSSLLRSSRLPPLAASALHKRPSRAASEASPFSTAAMAPGPCGQLVRVVSAVELVDPTGQGDGADGEAQDRQPPTEDRAQRDRDERQPAEQRPFALRREEPKVSSTLEDLTIGSVLGPRIDTTGDQGEIARDHQRQQ